jgi:isopentenyldiphosphate isomerase
MEATAEMVDVVDDDDRVVAVVSRKIMRDQRLQHRAVFIAVIDSVGRLLVHRRSEAKDLWPGWWDLAVGGVVSSGESYDLAARRELLEEVGIDAHPVQIGGGRYVDDDVALIGRCYLVRHDGPARPLDGEVVETRWVTHPQLVALLDEQKVLPDSRALLLPLVVDQVASPD